MSISCSDLSEYLNDLRNQTGKAKCTIRTHHDAMTNMESDMEILYRLKKGVRSQSQNHKRVLSSMEEKIDKK